MKRSVFMMILCLLLGAVSCAQAEHIGCMKVINCQEWVSLRERPDAKSACLVEVPLGALVENCREESKTFHYAEYNGMSGYIMAQYLEAVPQEQTYLGEMNIAYSGAWVPMYADTTDGAVIVQWMAPGEKIEDASESGKSYIYGVCRGMRGYISSDAILKSENASEMTEK